jgi:hypothetical protein
MTRRILIAMAMGGACAAIGCSSSGSSGTAGPGGGPGGPGQGSNLAPIQDLISPPGNPNAPGSNSNAPAGDPNAPAANENAPAGNPNAPGGPTAGGGGSCTALCAGIDPSCATQCGSLCAALDKATGICDGAVAAVSSCLSSAGLVCVNGKTRVPRDQCNEEGQALLNCGSTTVDHPPPPPPGSGGESNGGGSCNPFFDGFPPSCADAVATARNCIMNAGVPCPNGSPQPPNGECTQELSALAGCTQTPMGTGGTGP